MAIPDNVAHIVVSGTVDGGESFAFGWWEHVDDFDFSADLDLGTPWQTFRDELLSHMASDQTITSYDVYGYDGGIVVAHAQETVSHPGTDTSGLLPLQVSCVLTLRSATLSRQGRGRMYLPTCGFSIMAGGGHLFSSTQVGQLVDDFAAVLTAGNVAGGPAVVVSRVGSATHTITSVDADYVPDTQRRRRNKLVSARHSAAVT